MGQYSIKDIEILSGIKAHTLRIWEQRYNIVEPNRTDTNIRYYSDEQLKTILNVAVLNNSGFKISKIALMSPAEIAKAILKLDLPAGNHDNLINILVDAMIKMDKESALHVIKKAKNYNSLQEFFGLVIFPFLSRVGMLWTTNGINPAQEHFISNIIKRDLIVKIEELKEASPDAEMFLLLLPEGDWHELSLLVAEFILRARGKRVLYLGASVPDADIEKVKELVKVDYALCVSILAQNRESVQGTIDHLSEILDTSKVLFAGRAFYDPKLKFPQNAKVLHSFLELESI